MRRILVALATALLWTSSASGDFEGSGLNSPTPTGTPTVLPTLTLFPTRTPTDTRTPTMVRQPIVSFDRGGSCSVEDSGAHAPWLLLLLPASLWVLRRRASSPQRG